MCVYVCVCVCVYIYTYIYTYIHTYIHKYIHTHTAIHLLRLWAFVACSSVNFTFTLYIYIYVCVCVCVYIYIYIYIYKGEIHPRTGHEDPVGEKMYSSTLSLTSGIDRGGWTTPHPGRVTPGKETRYPLYRRLGGPQGRSGQVRKISPQPGFDPRTLQPVASRYTDWVIPATHAYVCMYVYIYTHIYTYIYVYICIYMCIYVYIYVYIYICIYIHTQTHFSSILD